MGAFNFWDWIAMHECAERDTPVDRAAYDATAQAIYDGGVKGEGADGMPEEFPALVRGDRLDFSLWAKRSPPGGEYSGGGAFDSTHLSGGGPFARPDGPNPLQMTAGRQQHLLPPSLRVMNYPKDRMQCDKARTVPTMSTYLKAMCVANVKMLREHTAPLPGLTPLGGVEGHSVRVAASGLLNMVRVTPWWMTVWWMVCAG